MGGAGLESGDSGSRGAQLGLEVCERMGYHNFGAWVSGWFITILVHGQVDGLSQFWCMGKWMIYHNFGAWVSGWFIKILVEESTNVLPNYVYENRIVYHNFG